VYLSLGEHVDRKSGQFFLTSMHGGMDERNTISLAELGEPCLAKMCLD
jgi:hypothetical protein